MNWLKRWRIHLLLFGVGLLVFGSTAGMRLRRQSNDPHFVYQADAWLNGTLAITDPPPPRGDDWAKVETVELDDGTVVHGRQLKTRKTFKIAGGPEVPAKRVKKENRSTTHYVSFPPFPSVLMIPQVLIHGRIANDVALTVLVAALVLPLLFSVLRRLAKVGLSQRTVAEDLWLVAAMAFGTVFYFSAVQGRVWFTAHVVGVALALLYTLASIEARRPVLAGVALGLATMTRVPLAFAFPLFAFEAWRMAGGRADLRRFFTTCAKFAAPVIVIAIIAMVHNAARFNDPFEFGHSYLAVKQQTQMEAYGKFSLHYLGRNLAVAFTLLPEIIDKKPYLTISGHGLAMWFTTPLLLLALWPRQKGALHRALWVTIGAVALPTLLYQNSGWLQFGYRFSLDYMVFLILLVALGQRPLRKTAKVLIILGIVINLFGAVTFARKNHFYRTDNTTYKTVVKH